MLSVDRRSYSKKTISIFEILSAHFVDIFYNRLFLRAKDLWINNKCDSITDGYKQLMYGYKLFVDKSNFYKETISGVLIYFKNSTRLHNISYVECIDKLISEFVPIDFVNQVSSNQKDVLLNSVFKSVTQTFMYEIIVNDIKHIIDGRGDESYVRILQDKVIDMLIVEREKLYSQFIKPVKIEKLPSDFLDKIRKNFDDVIKESNEIQKKLKMCGVLINRKNEIINAKDIEILRLKDRIRDLEEQAERMRFKQSLIKQTAPIPVISKELDELESIIAIKNEQFMEVKKAEQNTTVIPENKKELVIESIPTVAPTVAPTIAPTVAPTVAPTIAPVETSVVDNILVNIAPVNGAMLTNEIDADNSPSDASLFGKSNTMSVKFDTLFDD